MHAPNAACYLFDMRDNIVISPEAEADIDRVYAYIAYEVMAPETAVRYYIGIYDTIQKLSKMGYMLAVSQQPLLRQLYGADVRTVVYKKMTIVYNIIDNIVYIRRVMAGSMIR